MIQKLPKVLVDATAEPLTLDECRVHLRVDPIDGDTHPDDDLILSLLSAAREWCEGFLGMSIVTKTLELALDEFPSEDDAESAAIVLPMGPVNAVISVTVGEGSDSLMDEADYVLDDFSVPNRLVPVTTWPVAIASTNNIRVIYEAGFDGSNSSDGPTLPKSIKQAILLLVGDWYKHREDTDVHDLTIPNGVRTLLNIQRQRLGFA